VIAPLPSGDALQDVGHPRRPHGHNRGASAPQLCHRQGRGCFPHLQRHMSQKKWANLVSRLGRCPPPYLRTSEGAMPHAVLPAATPGATAPHRPLSQTQGRRGGAPRHDCARRPPPARLPLAADARATRGGRAGRPATASPVDGPPHTRAGPWGRLPPGGAPRGGGEGHGHRRPRVRGTLQGHDHAFGAGFPLRPGALGGGLGALAPATPSRPPPPPRRPPSLAACPRGKRPQGLGMGAAPRVRAPATWQPPPAVGSARAVREGPDPRSPGPF
jgi:hypothetical protein